MRLRLILIIVFLIIGFFSRGNGRTRPTARSGGNNVVSRPGQPDYFRTPESDPEMDKAIANAPTTVQKFIDALKSPQPNQKSFAIKKGFKQGAMTEYMWLTDVTYDGTNFRGVLNNDPVDVKNVKIGDALNVSPQEISDWMYVENGKLVGGYTLRVLFNRESPAGKKKLLEDTGFTIE
jgi:uncharacterized protein YegJ (DUF2314 family)